MPHLIWICPMSLASKLDAATWLETTRELRQEGWEVTLVTSARDDGRQTIRGIEVFGIAVPRIFFLKYVIFHWRFWKFLRRWKAADVILFYSASAPWILPLRLLRVVSRRKRPLLVMDTRSLHMPSRSEQGWKGYVMGTFERVMHGISVRGADGHTVITALMADSVRIPPRKLWGVWPSGVDVNRFSSCSVRRRWPIGREPVRLGYIGALQYERNLMGLVRAVEKANSEGQSFQFRLVGNGAQRASLEEYARQSSGRIEVRSAIPYDEIPEFLSQVHVGVLPFPDEEKFQVCSPIKLFEYMAAGLPILATRIPCHTGVMQNGAYVFWAERSDEEGLTKALRSIWQRRNALNDLSAAAASGARSWTWRSSALKLKSALENGLERSGAAASRGPDSGYGATHS
jgi:glycosyltransferase involved in cell wall biosynthesis